MLQFLSKIKNALSHVRTSSWHYKVVEGTFRKGRIQSAKACTYYWLLLPISLVVWVIAVVIMCIIYPLGWFWGYLPAPKESRNFFSAYKTSSSGEKVKYAPWEIIIPALVAWWVVADAVEIVSFLFGIWPVLAALSIMIAVLGI